MRAIGGLSSQAMRDHSVDDLSTKTVVRRRGRSACSVGGVWHDWPRGGVMSVIRHRRTRASRSVRGASVKAFSTRSGSAQPSLDAGEHTADEVSDDTARDGSAAAAPGRRIPERSAEGSRGRVDSRWKCGNRRGNHGGDANGKSRINNDLQALDDQRYLNDQWVTGIVEV